MSEKLCHEVSSTWLLKSSLKGNLNFSGSQKDQHCINMVINNIIFFLLKREEINNGSKICRHSHIYMTILEFKRVWILDSQTKYLFVITHLIILFCGKDTEVNPPPGWALLDVFWSWDVLQTQL